ncbi:MAG: 2OG-Fe(II) oxygenase family protein [Inhella sp.]
MPSLAPRNDLAQLRAEFQRHRRVLVPKLLAEPLLSNLRARLLSWRQWALVTRLAGEHRTFDSLAMGQLDGRTHANFMAQVQAEAQQGFQYLFERYALIDRGDAGQLDDAVLTQTYDLLRSKSLLELVREISGMPGIERVDGQLTRYRSGHFLNEHDDAAPTRRIAYSLNMSADWPPELGGQLQFLGNDGEVQSSWPPQFNALSLFAVPQMHRVQAVSADTDRCRFAITGWFHSPSA